MNSYKHKNVNFILQYKDWSRLPESERKNYDPIPYWNKLEEERVNKIKDRNNPDDFRDYLLMH